MCKTRTQTVLVDSIVQLSTLAASDSFRLLAVGEGETEFEEEYDLRQRKDQATKIFIYNTDSKMLVRTIPGHQKAIQSLAFVEEKYLISLTVKEEGSVRVWDIEEGKPFAGVQLFGYFNKVIAD
mmetsp:Transcript_6698/g.4829  ORF Transcript_6698/g.4829 Transcript_6698/m.4829 type:complete len:124 (+) Transcript_6698:3117-3488(+)